MSTESSIDPYLRAIEYTYGINILGAWVEAAEHRFFSQKIVITTFDYALLKLTLTTSRLQIIKNQFKERVKC